MPIHECVKRPQVSELLPVVAWHFVQHATLHMHHFIMGKGQHEPFGKRIYEGKVQLTLMVLAVNRLTMEILENIVHPAHVPLERKAKATLAGWLRYTRPRGGFLSDHQMVWKTLSHGCVAALKKFNRRQVLTSAKLVRNPLSLLA